MDWLDLFLSTEPIDRDVAREAVLQLYQDANLSEPTVIFVDSPAELFFRTAQITKASHQQFPKEVEVPVEIPELGFSRVLKAKVEYPQMWSNWMHTHLSRERKLSWEPAWNQAFPATGLYPKALTLMDALQNHLQSWQRYSAEFPKGWKRMKEKGVEGWWRENRWSVAIWRNQQLQVGPFRTYLKTLLQKEISEAELRLSENIWAAHLTPHFAFIMDRPQAIHFDEMNRLSAYPGPAVEFRDGSGIYMISGIATPRIPGKLTIEKIHAQWNSEVQRVLRESYGESRYLEDIGAVLKHEDQFGKLWSTKHLQSGQRLVMVEVVNSTPEPDGTFKHYFLQVPPEMKTAKEAVAWTFNISVNEYAPAVES